MVLAVPERTILAVLAYSAQFAYPLTQAELFARIFKPKHLYLVDKLKVQSKTFTAKDFSQALTKLVKSGLVVEQQGFFSLKTATVRSRKANTKIRQAKEKVISELIVFAEKLPWVLAVTLTGSFAAGVVKKKHDLDFLIITKRNRLWLTRLLFLVVASLRGRRPNLPEGDLSYSWDFNFWLDETSLALPAQKTGLYEAYEILQTKWLLNKKQLKQRFFLANNWVYDFFLFADFPSLKNFKHQPKSQAFDLWLPLEFLAFKLQDGYRQLRHGKQNTTLHTAFLHSKSTKRDILQDWKKHYQSAIGAKRVLVTGVFDVLHQEHRNFLLAAKQAGDYLIVGLESDKRVTLIKGAGRPIFNQETRKKNLEKLKIADEVFILPEDFQSPVAHQRLIETIKPDILAVSSHTAHQDKKAGIMKRFGGELKVVYQHNPAFSSTKIIKNRAHL